MKGNEVHTHTFYIKLVQSVRKAAPTFFSLLYSVSMVSGGVLLLVPMETGLGSKNSGQFNVLTHHSTLQRRHHATAGSVRVMDTHGSLRSFSWENTFHAPKAFQRQHGVPVALAQTASLMKLVFMFLQAPAVLWFGLWQVTSYSATESGYYNYIIIAFNSALYFYIKPVLCPFGYKTRWQKYIVWKPTPQNHKIWCLNISVLPKNIKEEIKLTE